MSTEDIYLHGKRRFPLKRLKGSSATPGTIVGPNDTGEYLVVVSRDGDDALLGFAQSGDVYEALMHPDAPRSIAELRLQKQ